MGGWRIKTEGDTWLARAAGEGAAEDVAEGRSVADGKSLTRRDAKHAQALASTAAGRKAGTCRARTCTRHQGARLAFVIFLHPDAMQRGM